MLIPHVLAQLARPMRRLNRRNSWIEALVDTPLSSQDEHLLRAACTESGGTNLGEYYYWYLQKLFVAKALRRGNRAEFLSMLTRGDHTDYSSFDALARTPKGLLIAIPHHAHYILSIIMLAERIRHHRQTLLFYGDPESHPGNEVFDRLNSWFWNDENRVGFVHDTRKGLATAIRKLKDGAAVFIMPDVFKDENATLAIPFCGRTLNIMMGTSVLARKTGAAIIPMISTPASKGIGFRSVFAPAITPAAYASAPAREHSLIAGDYRVMRRLFSFYEQHMRHQLIYWQNVRQHIAQGATHVEIDRGNVSKVADLMLEDPELLEPSAIIDIRQAPTE